jgi:general secretion pathway protein I
MSRSSRAGFTLLELLVATVIMATAVTGLLAALSTSMRNAARLTEYDRAAMLANRKMEELLSQGRLPRNAPLAANFDPSQTGGIPMGWRARVAAFELPPNPGPGQFVIDRVELQVWWRIADRERVFSLESYRRSLLTPEDMQGGGLRP